MMNTAIILSVSFLALVGLQLCVPVLSKWEQNPDYKNYLLREIEKTWTDNPFVRIFYGLLNLLGVLFVFLMLGYMVFFVHWWYLGVYLLGVMLARIPSGIIRAFLATLHGDSGDFLEIRVVKSQRVVGSLIILFSIVLFFLSLLLS